MESCAAKPYRWMPFGKSESVHLDNSYFSLCLKSDIEKLEGLPVAAFMDRDKVTKHTAQIGFIKFILIPLVEAIEELFPIIRVRTLFLAIYPFSIACLVFRSTLLLHS